MVVFQLLLRKFWIQTIVLWLSTISLLISHCLWVHAKYTWSKKDVGSPKSTSWLSTFHIGSMFCFFPANFLSSTDTDKNNPFSRCTNKHSQLETFSQPYFNRIFSSCLFHDNPAKRRLYRFRSRRTTGSSIYRGRRIQMSGHSDLGIFNNFGTYFILSGYEQILHQLLVLRTLAVWIWYPWLLLPSLVMLMILVLWILYKIQNHLLHFRLGIQLDLCMFGALPPIRHSSNGQMSISEAKWTFAPFVLASSITSDLLLTFVTSHAGSTSLRTDPHGKMKMKIERMKRKMRETAKNAKWRVRREVRTHNHMKHGWHDVDNHLEPMSRATLLNMRTNTRKCNVWKVFCSHLLAILTLDVAKPCHNKSNYVPGSSLIDWAPCPS